MIIWRSVVFVYVLLRERGRSEQILFLFIFDAVFVCRVLEVVAYHLTDVGLLEEGKV